MEKLCHSCELPMDDSPGSMTQESDCGDCLVCAALLYWQASAQKTLYEIIQTKRKETK